jgi:hypothetical protein
MLWLASSTRLRHCWITLVIFSLARLPLPGPDLDRSGLVAHAAISTSASSPDPEETPSGPAAWEWRWVSLCPGSFCPIAAHPDSASQENDPDTDCTECEADVEFIPTGQVRRIANPLASLAFDAIPAAHDDRHLDVSAGAISRSFVATFPPSISRAALFQRWIC